MARFGMFGLGQRDPRGEERARRRLIRRAAGAVVVAAAVLALGLVVSQGAHASNATLSATPNPVHVAGGQTSGTTVLQWDTGTGMNGTVYVDHGGGPQLFTSGVSGATEATVYCNEANKYTLEDAASNQVLATLTVGVTGCPSPAPSSTPKPSPSATPKPSPSASPSPSPAAKPLVLTPNGSWHSSKYYQAWESGLCDIGGDPFFPSYDWASSFSQVAVGYDHYYDGGICWVQQDSFDRGAVQFDWNQVNSYVQAHGFKSAELSYTGDAATIGCAGRIEEASDDLSALHPFPPVIPDGKNLTPAPVISLNKGSVDVGGVIAFAQIFGGVDPHMHFIFIGPDEGLDAQDSNSCTTVLSNFKLTIVPEH